MSSNVSSDQEDNNDKDFNIEDYRDEIDSDESFQEASSKDPLKKVKKLYKHFEKNSVDCTL